MGFFHKKKNVLPIPDGFAPDSIRVESSICTGETTIGFILRQKNGFVMRSL